MAEKKKIAVLGGGMSSLVSVFELTKQPNWSDSYDITVYQTGWRLGGKGASGRNKKLHMRNEEHGLHVLFGFYDNAFRVMKQCYDELGRNPSEPLATWQDAFKPHSLVVMMDPNSEGKYEPWVLDWPTNELTPGEGGSILPPWVYVVQVFKWCIKTIERWLKDSRRASPEESEPPKPEDTNETLPSFIFNLLDQEKERLEDRIDMFLSGSRDNERRGLISRIAERFKRGRALIEEISDNLVEDLFELPLATAFALSLDNDPTRHTERDHERLLALTDRLLTWVNSRSDLDEAFRRARVLLNLGFSIIRGMIKDRVIIPPIDWFKIDNMDFKEWLVKHGARKETVQATPLFGVYGAAYSENAGVAAGTAIHAILRMALSYKGAFLWMMQAGMGDTIFTPLMQVLERRGVKFKFFHQVEQLHLSKIPGVRHVETIDFTIQADVIQKPYRPCIDVKGLACWPTEPLYDQLVQGEEIETGGYNLEDWWSPWPGVRKMTLERGKDFDLVILGISIAALPALCQDLVDDPKNPSFKKMVEKVATTQTQGVQFWIRPDLKQFGWPTPPPVVIPYGHATDEDRNPLDTWADMSHLIKAEDWPATLPVGDLSYLTSSLTDDEPIPPRTDHGYPARQNRRVKEIAREWLKKRAAAIWPNAVTADKEEFNWSWLVDPLDRTGEDRFQSQFWHAPNSLSERYVLSVPNGTSYRLRANQSGYPNLILTGDWLLTAMSAGCLEAAVMGGIQAAQAINPKIPDAFGDWLPPMKTPTFSTYTEGEVIPHHEVSPPTIPPNIKPKTPTPTTPTEKARVPYIERDGDQIASPPVKLVTSLYTFALQAGMKELQELCDRELNLPGSPVVYRPFAPFVILYASDINNFPITNPLGWVREKDFGFWVPVVAGEMHHGTFVAKRPLTYTPYIWVDSGVALVGGRSVFGFPKEIGSMGFPKTIHDPPTFSLDATVMKVFSPESQASIERLINIHRKDTTLREEILDSWRDAEHFAEVALGSLTSIFNGEVAPPTLSLIRSFFKQLSIGTPVVFLKQLPAADDATKAVYQAIVEAEINTTGNVSGGILRGDFDVEIFSYASHKIVKTLGLVPREVTQEKSTINPFFQARMKFDGVVKPGTVIWQTT